MENKTGATALIIVVFIIGVARCKDSSGESSDESVSPPSFLAYKVQALNTALYYVLHALQDDLNSGEVVDISFINRIKIIVAKIEAFQGEIVETNALMLGELRRSFPEYLLNVMTQEGLNFDEFTTHQAPEDAEEMIAL